MVHFVNVGSYVNKKVWLSLFKGLIQFPQALTNCYPSGAAQLSGNVIAKFILIGNDISTEEIDLALINLLAFT